MQSISVFLGIANLLIFKENMLISVELKWYVTYVMFFGSSFRKVQFIVGYVRHILERGRLFRPPNPWATLLKRPTVMTGKNRIKLFKQHFLNSDDYSKAMIKFGSKFQFQSLLQFYRTAEKVTKIKLVMVIVKFWKILLSFQTSLFSHYFVFSWLRLKHTEYKVSLT